MARPRGEVRSSPLAGYIYVQHYSLSLSRFLPSWKKRGDTFTIYIYTATTMCVCVCVYVSAPWDRSHIQWRSRLVAHSRVYYPVPCTRELVFRGLEAVQVYSSASLCPPYKRKYLLPPRWRAAFLLARARTGESERLHVSVSL